MLIIGGVPTIHSLRDQKQLVCDLTPPVGSPARGETGGSASDAGSLWATKEVLLGKEDPWWHRADRLGPARTG